jgi:hypothetical protein
MGTDFFIFVLGLGAGIPKKSVPIGEIRKIRTSICITISNLLFTSNETSQFGAQNLMPKLRHFLMEN